HRSDRRLLIGEPDNQLTPRLNRLGEWPRRAGFDCRESLDIQGDIWFKLWGNLSMNPISLLTTATSDRIISDPLLRRLSVSMMEEAARIGALIGVRQPGRSVWISCSFSATAICDTCWLSISIISTAGGHIGRLVNAHPVRRRSVSNAG